MSQKKITSFFKSATDTNSNNIIKPKKRKLVIRDDDDDDGNEIGHEEKRQADPEAQKMEADENEEEKKQGEESTKKPSLSNADSRDLDGSPQEVRHKLAGSPKEEKPKVGPSKFLLGSAQANSTLETFYNPAKAKYHPVIDAFWEKSHSTPYLALSRTFQLIEEISERSKMADMLSNFYASVIMLNPDDLLHCVYLSINQLAPAYEGFELGIAEHTLIKAICNATGRSMEQIKEDFKSIGDLGIVAEKSRCAQRTIFTPKPLTIPYVFKKLKEIANATGQGKANLIKDVFVACRHSEARFFIRSLLGKLRIGVGENVLMKALAAAIVKTNYMKRGELQKVWQNQDTDEFKEEIEAVLLTFKTAYCQCPNYDLIIPNLLEHGINKLLDLCPMTPGVPLKPMLAHPTKGVSEIKERFKDLKITCEWKYDGERAQIHCDDKGVISIYSRNQENNTAKYPDVIERIDSLRTNNVSSFILDSEIVAWDNENKQILPFQILSTRKRKNVNVEDIKVQVCVYIFDLLYLNGNALITETFAKRRELLKENFREVEGLWKFATACDTTNMEDVQEFLDEAIKGSCEGLMIKTLEVDATYEIAKRSRNWLKLKKDYVSNVGDTLDLVVIGGYYGKGKRTGVYGGFLLACFDDETEDFQTICKIGTGFSDDDLQNHSKNLKEHLIPSPKPYYQYDKSLEPDAWFEAVRVWEIKCADFSLSPVHRAAIGVIDDGKGISLRFPRFIRERDDKSAEDATSAQQISLMYLAQSQIQNVKGQGPK